MPKYRPILLLTQGHAGDRLGARLAQSLRERFPDRELIGLGGNRMRDAGVRIIARTDTLSAMGYTGLLPLLPRALWTLRQAARGVKQSPPAGVIAVDFWQPLRFLHRATPQLAEVPHLCYLPPGPNFIGQSRVHAAVARAFGSIVTPFPHQARLFREAGGHIVPGAHAGLQTCREEGQPLPADARENLLALLPGSRSLEVRYSLPVQYAAAREILARYPELVPVVCCADERVERLVQRLYPGLKTERNGRAVMARARFGLICSGTAALEAAILGCPGVVTYHGSPLQRWEWRRFHVDALARLRAQGIASPYVSLPNIMAGEELYPEQLDTPAEAVAEATLRELSGDLRAKREKLDRVTEMLAWEDAGQVVAREAERLLGQ